jgi:endonuclease-3
MVAASRAKTSDRAAILKKLLPAIKKQYKVVVPKHDRPVLETMLFAICMEDVSVDEAELAFERLGQEFPDLNEIRVSSISEIERAFEGLPRSEWRAFHVRSVLQYVFEKSFAFEFEGLRKKTLELAQKQLAKIKHLSNFVRNYTLQSVIGAHQIPIDESMARALIWLGLVPPNQDAEQMGETLKAVVRKAEVPQFCFSLRCLATDKVVQEFFDPKKYPPPTEGHDGAPVAERLADLYKAAATKSKSKPVAATKSTTNSKATETKSTAKPAKAASTNAATSAAAPKKKAAAKPVAKAIEKPVKKVVKKAR